jgi:hypothetical protein
MWWIAMLMAIFASGTPAPTFPTYNSNNQGDGLPKCSINRITSVVSVYRYPIDTLCVRLINNGAAQPVLNPSIPVQFPYTPSLQDNEVAVTIHKTDACAGILAIIVCNFDDKDSWAVTQAPKISNAICTHYSGNNAIAVEKMNPDVKCAFSRAFNQFGYMDLEGKMTLFAQSNVSILPILLYSSSKCSQGTLIESVNSCRFNSSSMYYKGSEVIPTVNPSTFDEDGNGNVNDKESSAGNQNQARILFGYAVSDFTFNIVVVCFSLIAAAIVLSAGVLLRNYQRKLSEKVHSFENGQEEIENPEECSVKINDVGEQLPLSYDVIQGKISPMKRRVLS